MTIVDQEIETLRAQYLLDKTEYEHLSDHVMMQCQRYKKLHPKRIRVVFSRQPAVKEWDSIVNKIRLKREKNGKASYGYGDIEDLIGLTILCAFESDRRPFINWMRKAFEVETHDTDAIRNDPETGHRGLHYIVRAHHGACVSSPEWQNKKCEIQIKTLLEEAFDAKSHDLAYKPGHLVVTDQMKQQFLHFSNVLHAVDKQSEFLKELIMANERQISLRRAACVALYLGYENDLIYGRQHGLDPTIKQPAPDQVEQALATIQGLSRKEPSIGLCRLTASYALNYEDELFARQALIMCESLAKAAPADSNVQTGVATVEWALGDLEAAMGHLMNGIEHASDSGSTISPESAKSTYAYLYADWSVRQPSEKRPEWQALAATYVAELSQSKALDVLDSLGFYRIVFGQTREEIEQGRLMVSTAHKSARADLRPFFLYHEYIAVQRLAEVLAHEMNALPGNATTS